MTWTTSPPRERDHYRWVRWPDTDEPGGYFQTPEWICDEIPWEEEVQIHRLEFGHHIPSAAELELLGRLEHAADALSRSHSCAYEERISEIEGVLAALAAARSGKEGGECS